MTSFFFKKIYNYRAWLAEVHPQLVEDARLKKEI